MNTVTQKIRPLVIFIGLLMMWYLVTLTGIPAYMLPTPMSGIWWR